MVTCLHRGGTGEAVAMIIHGGAELAEIDELHLDRERALGVRPGIDAQAIDLSGSDHRQERMLGPERSPIDELEPRSPESLKRSIGLRAFGPQGKQTGPSRPELEDLAVPLRDPLLDAHRRRGIEVEDVLR